MTREEIRILSYLSDSLGNGGSILGIKEGIRRRYGKAHYKNIYDAIMSLKKIGVISITTEGKNSLIKLDTRNPLSIYYISEAENQKAIEISMSGEMMDELLNLALDSDMISMCALKQEEYSKINRMELLIITRSHDQEGKLIDTLLGIESMYNIKIDPIILTPREFSNMVGSDELNHIRYLIADKIILYNSEGFWRVILRHRIGEQYKDQSKFPERLDRSQLAYNYNRFGYGLYEDTKAGKEIALEAAIFLMSTSGEARIRYGAFILLCKGIRKINLSYLYYLFKRHEQLGMLKSMLASSKEFFDNDGRARIEALIRIIPNRQLGAYDRKLIKKYMVQYS